MGNWQINDFIPDPNTGKNRCKIRKIFKGGIRVVYIVTDNEVHESFLDITSYDKFISA